MADGWWLYKCYNRQKLFSKSPFFNQAKVIIKNFCKSQNGLAFSPVTAFGIRSLGLKSQIRARTPPVPIGVNLTSNVLPVCCLTIRVRAPLIFAAYSPASGGDRSLLFCPPDAGDARGIETWPKATFIRGLGLKLKPMSKAVSLHIGRTIYM